MNNTSKKYTNNVKYIPTELNYFNYINQQIKRIKKHCTTSRLLIIALIIWNIILTCSIIPAKTPANIPQFTDKENQEIMIQESIPPYDLPPLEEIK